MNYWWVNHGGSFNMENHYGYLSAPIKGHHSWKVLKKHTYTNEIGEIYYIKVTWVNLNILLKH